ncbi:MAG: hypothetical protein WAW23_11295, partial [Candidatus Methanoperedens sp.]
MIRNIRIMIVVAVLLCISQIVFAQQSRYSDDLASQVNLTKSQTWSTRAEAFKTLQNMIEKGQDGSVLKEKTADVFISLLDTESKYLATSMHVSEEYT